MPSRKFVGNWPFCPWPFWYGELKCCWWPPTRGSKGHFESLGIQQEKIYIPFLYIYTYIYIYMIIYNKLPFPPRSLPCIIPQPSNPWGHLNHPKAPSISPSPGAGDCGLTATCRNLITGFPKQEHYPEGQILRVDRGKGGLVGWGKGGWGKGWEATFFLIFLGDVD